MENCLSKLFKWKEPHNTTHLMYISPHLVMAMIDMALYCESYNKPFVITSSIRSFAENKALHARSLTHVEGRAVDVSVKDWNDSFISEFVDRYNRKYSNIGAISSVTGRSLFVIHHDSGNGPHLHIQVRRNL
jgi:uncharacterized protein YcbK (DUF882 family)